MGSVLRVVVGCVGRKGVIRHYFWSGRGGKGRVSGISLCAYLAGIRKRGFGPLDLFLQGMDYAYTFDGWLRTVNAEVLWHDPGSDGLVVGNDTSYYARDVFSLLLRYYPNDYRPIKPGVPSLEASINSGSQHLFKPYYTGWISSWSLWLDTLHTAYSFRYDQMGRLTRARTLSGFSGQQWNATLVNRYSTRYRYDLVGNILSLVRYDGSGNLLDSLRYDYYDLSLNNRLKSISDAVSTQFPHDLESQPSVNYLYDPVGNMVRDVSRNLSVKYNYSNRPRLLTLGNSTLRMLYNPAGYRFFKGTDDKGDIFIYNTQGQLMAKYRIVGDTLRLDFLPIYEGTRRLGIYEPEGVEWVAGSGKLSLLPHIYVLPCLSCPMQLIRVRRYALKPTRKYELTDHLGNVRVVIADQRLAVADSANPSVVGYYKPKVVRIQDYYPYGWLKNAMSYHFGANAGSLLEDWDAVRSIYYTLYRVLDTRIARWYQVELLLEDFPQWSGYSLIGNMPNIIADPLGDDTLLFEQNSKGEWVYVGRIVCVEEERVGYNTQQLYARFTIRDTSGKVIGQETIPLIKEVTEQGLQYLYYMKPVVVREGEEWKLKGFIASRVLLPASGRIEPSYIELDILFFGSVVFRSIGGWLGFHGSKSLARRLITIGREVERFVMAPMIARAIVQGDLFVVGSEFTGYLLMKGVRDILRRGIIEEEVIMLSAEEYAKLLFEMIKFKTDFLIRSIEQKMRSNE